MQIKKQPLNMTMEFYKNFYRKYYNPPEPNKDQKVIQRKMVRVPKEIIDFLKTTEIVIKDYDISIILKRRLAYQEDLDAIKKYM